MVFESSQVESGIRVCECTRKGHIMSIIIKKYEPRDKPSPRVPQQATGKLPEESKFVFIYSFFMYADEYSQNKYLIPG